MAWLACWAAVGILIPGCGSPPSPGEPPADGSSLVLSVKSRYSDIRVRDANGTRSLYFVEPGEEVRQTSMILHRPGYLAVPYTRYMFASMLVKQPQRRVLVVGLGGGAMVRFLNQHFPGTSVDAVEIDPEVVKIAADLFHTRPSRRTRIFTEDAFDYLKRDTGRYDVIYMDAFLEPGPDTDPRGIPQHLKTADFLRGLSRNLSPGGVVAFNLSELADYRRDVRTIASAFPTIYEFRVPGTKNRVVIASLEETPISPEKLRAAGRNLDGERSLGFSFEKMVNALEKTQTRR